MDGLFEEDEDSKMKRKKQKEYGGEGDMDEMEYEEDFADDEEKVDEDNEDEVAKELEVGLIEPYRDDLEKLTSLAGAIEARVQECQ